MRKNQKHATVLFICLILFAGLLHMMDSSPNIDVNTVLFNAIYSIYVGLIMFWLQSVRKRLLPTRSCTYIRSAAALMILMLFLRAMKYRLAAQAATARFLWYSYYIPIIMIPTLFLLSCIRICYPHGGKQKLENGLLIISSMLTAGMLTNDLHFFAFVPSDIPLKDFYGDSGTYEYGFLFYASYTWIALGILAGIGFLFRSARMHHDFKKAAVPFSFFLLLVAVMGVNKVFDHLDIRTPYQLPETVIFCMIGLFESCIRLRMIPFNVDSEEIFRVMELPAMITGYDFKPVLQSASPLSVTLSDCQNALQEPVYPAAHIRLQGKAIRGGYVFWTSDERELYQMNEKLLEANETLANENTLIEAENRQQEEIARMDFVNRIHHRIAAELYPTQMRIRAILENMKPDASGFQRNMAKVCVLNAYVKRATNLMFMAADSETVSSRELYLAMGETARYLKYTGVSASVTNEATQPVSSENVFPIYRTFEQLVEALLPQITLLSATLYDGRLRLAVNTETADLPETVLPVKTMTEDGMLYLTAVWKGAPV